MRKANGQFSKLCYQSTFIAFRTYVAERCVTTLAMKKHFNTLKKTFYSAHVPLKGC